MLSTENRLRVRSAIEKQFFFTSKRNFFQIFEVRLFVAQNNHRIFLLIEIYYKVSEILIGVDKLLLEVSM